MKQTKEIKQYFKKIDEETKKVYKFASEARKKGFDPEPKVEIPLVKDLAGRVEGLISTVSPQIVGTGVQKRIKELEKKYGFLDWRVALTIALEVAQEKFCRFDNKKEAIETGIRVGFAYITLGTVASPLEGLTQIRIKKRKDNKDYFALFFSGPIRSAGGTGASVCVLIADYVRRKTGYDSYDPTEIEVQRMVTELYDYHEKITNLQYLPSKDEIEFLVQNIPLQIDGEPTEKIEVSNYKDLTRIETNNIRNGPCLVIGEGLAQKAPKILKQIKKWGKQFELEHWLFLEKFLEIQKKVKAKGEKKEEKRVRPDYTFIADLVAGRPVLTYPLRTGGFRLRYGRTRCSGYSSTSLHPMTMKVLDDFVATGTQFKVERPGKATAITVCDTISGPIVRLKNGSVVVVEKQEDITDEIEEILFLGDILISYGDFLNRAHVLVPAGYCEEWWIQDLEKATVTNFGSLDIEKLSEFVGIPSESLDILIKKPTTTKITADAAINLSKKLNIPLHPHHTYYWGSINADEFKKFVSWLRNIKLAREENILVKGILPLEKEGKEALDKIGIPHLVINKEFVVIQKQEITALLSCLGLSNHYIDGILETIEKNKDKNTLEILNTISEVKIMDKGGTFIGARMGRPEKAKIRKLTGSPQVLFPVGEEGGRFRSFQSALDVGLIRGDFPIYYCPKCNKQTVFSICEDCSKETRRKYYCKLCGLIDKEECPKHGKADVYRTQNIDIRHYFDVFIKKLGMKTMPDLIKGVRGTSNKDHVPEHLAKGILRSKHDIYVNKDGTTRYDMTQLSITHFKPKEIGTNIEKLKELGYTKDIYEKELTNQEQILELKPQDIILPSCKESPDKGADKILFNVANFMDELRVKLYNLKPFYNLNEEKDLIGHLVMALAPHTSAGVVGRIIGFSKTQGFFAHPFLHAATRRDCLGYNTYIPIKEGNIWQIQKIGKFVEKLNPKEKADNLGTLKKEVSNIHTLSNPGREKIADVTKHKPRKIIKICLEDGRKIKLTQTHRLYLKGHKEKRACDIGLGDKLVISYKKNIKERDIKEIFLPEIFQGRGDIMLRGIKDYLGKFTNLSKHENFYQRDSFPINFVKKLLNKHNKTLQDLPPQTKIAVKRDNVLLPIKIPLDKKLLEVIGLYISEGFIRKNTSKKGFYQISIAGNKKIKNLVKEVFYSHFGLKPSEDHEDHVTFSSKIIYELFKKYLQTGNRAKNKRIPSLFLNLKKEKISALLRGYFEGDGSVSLSDNRVTCDTVSEGLKHDLSFVLSRFGIFTKFYEYRKTPGPLVRKFYTEKNKKIPKFKITKVLILSNFIKKFRQIGFISDKKNRILNELCKNNPRGMQIDFDENYVYPKVIQTEEIKEEKSYCLNVRNEHNFFSNDILVHNCDGDEASVVLLMDALINFSRHFLPAHRGSTQDAPLVLTSNITASEIDDMAFDIDIGWKYPLEFYQASLEYKQPWDIQIKKVSNVLDTEKQYEGFGFTHHSSSINLGARCSAYKTLPSMEEKLKGQLGLAEKIRAVDTEDVARLVIEKHFLKDIKGNLRKFSIQQFRCVKCNEKYRRPPLVGKCTRCNGRIIFTISEGFVTKYLEPSISLANKYNVPAYLKHNLELLKRRVEGVFGKQKETQAGLGDWFTP